MIATSATPVTRLERVALVVALALTAALMMPMRLAVNDGTYVHLQYARHLASGQGLVFNVGERVYGCTSPLWAALLADGIMLGFDGLRTARVLGALSTLAAVVFFFQLLRRTLRTPALRAAGTIAWAGHAWLLRWSMSGSEAPLAVALTLAGFVAFVDGRPWRTGALWALAALTRPEAAVLLLLWVAVLLIDTENRDGLRRMVAGTLPPLVIYGGWLLFARVYFGTFWPQIFSTPARRGDSALGILESLTRQVQLLTGTEAALAVMLALALLAAGPRLWRRPGVTRRLVPWCWVLALPLLYAMRRVSVTSQHLILVMPVLAWLAWRAAERWWLGDDEDEPAPVWMPAAAALLAVLVLGQNLIVYRRTVVPEVREETLHTRGSLVPWGRWFGEHTEPGALIATSEIGAIGYHGQRRVLDLNGVVTPAMIGFLQNETAADAAAAFRFAAFARPDFLVDVAPRPYALLARSRFAAALIPIGHAPIGAGVRGASSRFHSFYRVDWAAFDSLRAPS
ncbi:MAG TPA: hypothetical protein VEY91_01925 [Candidatus Limnocylindria bacterium]|nr:hypothetical protein [Candidatus Limnocylindria bacterium]